MLGIGQKLLRIAPAQATKSLKAAFVYPRFWLHRSRAKKSYRRYSDKYKRPILFVAGLPKSGTTWLERMLSTYPGYEEILIPEASFGELKTGQGHIFDIPLGALDRLSGLLAITKMHCHGSRHNVSELKRLNIPYVISTVT